MFGTLFKTASTKGAQLSRPAANTISKTYATQRVHTPQRSTNSNESLNNNPVIVCARKKKKSVIMQHSEWVEDFCDLPGCKGRLCTGLCAKKLMSQSRAHFTHSDKEEHSPHKVSDNDFDKSGRALYAKPYANPHETSGESYNPAMDTERTKKLQEMLEEIKTNINNHDEKL